MSACKDCERPLYDCICPAVAKFFKEHGHLMSRLSEQEAKEKGIAKCIGCFYHSCRCAAGLRSKRKAS